MNSSRNKKEPPQELGALRELLDLRMTLELFALKRMHEQDDEEVARRIAAAQLDRSIASMKKASTRKDYEVFFKEDYLLHENIVGLSGLPLLSTLWRQVSDHLSQFHQDSLKIYWPDLRVLHSEHEYLVKGIESNDPVAAEDGIRHHLEAIWFRMAEQAGELAQVDDPLHRALAYLALHFHRHLTLKEVAENIAFCSAGHLSKRFRGEFQTSYQGYLLTLRLNKAAELIRSTSMPIIRIMQRVGYNDASRFSLHFRRRFSLTPTQWRRSHRGGK
ncbi:MAG: helix-turn-helix domain-containing protein [Akkermansiaceae bacterium]